MQVNYKSGIVSEEYYCHQCKVSGCKLWREFHYQTCNPRLLCARCVLKDQKRSGEFDDRGYRADEHGKTDQCGWYVPAIPDEEDFGFWGYTSVPPEGVEWWRNLPTYAPQ